MSLAEKLKDILLEDTESTISQAASQEKSSSLRLDIFKGLTAEEIEAVFEKCSHKERIDCVDIESRKIPRRHWWTFSSYLNTDEAARTRWGLDKSHTDELESAVVCTYDDGQVEVLTVETQISESHESTTQNKANLSLGFRRFVNIVAKIGRKKSDAESESETKTITKEITECPTDRGNCKLNRQAFIKYGREIIARGSGNRTYLDQELDHIANEIGIETDDQQDTPRVD